MFEFVVPELHTHKYYLFGTGTKLKARYYSTRTEAEIAMYTYCNKNGIQIECSERDKHERRYSTKTGDRKIEFYINRV